VLQELLVNMKKHSKAQNVVIRFEQTGKQMTIQYTDDGVGMPSGNNFGNGLTNTGTRIQGLNGAITFDNGAVKGTKILISFPIEHT
jgi:signal transduction histidine kinase